MTQTSNPNRPTAKLATFAFAALAPFAALANDGVPTLVDTNADLGAQQPGPELGWADSIYFTSRLDAGGHDIGLLVHTLTIPNGPGEKLVFSIVDETTGWYTYEVVNFRGDDFQWGEGGLDISAPGMTWSGDDQEITVTLDYEWGGVDLVLRAEGPAMIYGGTGAWPLFGHINHEFGFPNMVTTGTVTINGETHDVSGHSWLDRQWGPVTPDESKRWTWMNLNLPNGDAVAIWDSVGPDGENSWATVLHPDGSHEIVAAEPFADRAGEFWTSEVSGATFPTHWNIAIPALDADITVDVTGTDDQEIVIHGEGRFEASAAFTGTYQGEEVSGKNYIEMFGAWK